MVRFRASGSGSGNGVSAPGGGTIVLKKATSEEIGEAVDALWVLVKERERLVREVWGGFVGRWGGRVERGDDGRMFVVDGGTAQKEEQEGGEEKGKKKMEGQVEDDEADPYVKRMREVQARMDDLEVAQERVRDKRERAGRAKEEYEKGSGSPSGRASGGS